MATNHIDREHTTREKTTRKRAWQRPEVLPSPTPEPGYAFHWVRVATLGQVDATNVSSKLREGIAFLGSYSWKHWSRTTL